MSFWFGHDIPSAWILMNLFSSLKFSLRSTKSLEAFFKLIAMTNVNDSCLEIIEFVFYVYLRPSHGKFLNKIMVYVGVCCICMCVWSFDFYPNGRYNNKTAYCIFQVVGFH